MWPFKKSKSIVDNNLLSLTIDLSENTDFKFSISIYDTSPSSAEKVAKLIYAFNRGLLLPHIIELLLSKGKEGEEMDAFVSSVFENLNSYYETEKSGSPLIPPTEAFKKLNITKNQS